MPTAVAAPERMLIAMLIDTLCERWGQLPSAIRAEDAHEVFELLYYRSLRNGAAPSDAPTPPDPLAGIPMIALGAM